MDFFKNQFGRVQEQLNGLTATQRMLTMALVAIMVMTLVWWGKYAGDPEMVPLLDQAMSQADVGQITTHLRTAGVPFTTPNNRVLVPAERLSEALGSLAFANALPPNTQVGFDEMIKSINPLSSPTERDAVLKRAKEQALSQVIQKFPGVATAFVMIDPAPRRTIGTAVAPSATVTLTTRPGAPVSKQLAVAAANVVAGASAGLSPANIKVVVDGMPQRLPDSNGLAGGIGSDEQLEARQKNERHYQDKILELLADMGKVFVTIEVDVETERTERQVDQFDEDMTFTKDVHTRTQSSESINSGPAAGEPGASPNVGGANVPMALGGGGGAAAGENSVTETTEETNSMAFPSRKTERIFKGPGEAAVTGASVRVPRSYFVTAFKGANANAPEPDEKQLDAFIQREISSITKQVMHATGLKTTERLSVDTYFDLPLPVAAAPQPQLASVSLPLGLGNYTKEIALGGLALVSLFMVSMMVRKASPVPAVAAAAVALPGGGVVAPALVDSAEPLAGEVAGGDPLMDGMELDEEAVQTRQMIDQVSTLVGENPDAAANLLKRWLNRG